MLPYEADGRSESQTDKPSHRDAGTRLKNKKKDLMDEIRIEMHMNDFLTSCILELYRSNPLEEGGMAYQNIGLKTILFLTYKRDRYFSWMRFES